MTYEAAFRTVFWAKKGTKRRSKHYFNMLTEAFLYVVTVSFLTLKNNNQSRMLLVTHGLRQNFSDYI